jgi:hypothetical protein
MSRSNEDSVSGRCVGFARAAWIPNVLELLEIGTELRANCCIVCVSHFILLLVVVWCRPAALNVAHGVPSQTTSYKPS